MISSALVRYDVKVSSVTHKTAWAVPDIDRTARELERVVLEKLGEGWELIGQSQIGHAATLLTFRKPILEQ